MHLAGTSALALPAWTLTQSLRAQAETIRGQHKGVILLWMSGGPSTIDMWDLKPGAATSGPFRPIATTGEAEICEHLPLLAQQMKHLSVVRSMSTIEADHTRGQYYLQTGFRPTEGVLHPCYGAVVAHELAPTRPKMDLPPFVAINGDALGPGFLGMTWAPFIVSSDGRLENVRPNVNLTRFVGRMHLLRELESQFIEQHRGSLAQDHALVLDRTLSMMTSAQLNAFAVARESRSIRERYGAHPFGQGCLLARRLIEVGVPFVEVDFGGWDNHQEIFSTLRNEQLPVLDRGFSVLIEDLSERGLLDSTLVMCFGEFGRTPRVNTTAGRDHFARAWSVVLGGGGIVGGQVIGQTSPDGTEVLGKSYSAQDLMATVLKALGISLETNFQTPNGRPIKIANGGQVIQELLA